MLREREGGAEEREAKIYAEEVMEYPTQEWTDEVVESEENMDER